MRSHDAEEEPAHGRRDRPHVVVLWWIVGAAINPVLVLAFMALVAVLAHVL